MYGRWYDDARLCALVFLPVKDRLAAEITMVGKCVDSGKWRAMMRLTY